MGYLSANDPHDLISWYELIIEFGWPIVVGMLAGAAYSWYKLEHGQGAQVDLWSSVGIGAALGVVAAGALGLSS